MFRHIPENAINIIECPPVRMPYFALPQAEKSEASFQELEKAAQALLSDNTLKISLLNHTVFSELRLSAYFDAIPEAHIATVLKERGPGAATIRLSQSRWFFEIICLDQAHNLKYFYFRAYTGGLKNFLDELQLIPNFNNNNQIIFTQTLSLSKLLAHVQGYIQKHLNLQRIYLIEKSAIALVLARIVSRASPLKAADRDYFASTRCEVDYNIFNIRENFTYKRALLMFEEADLDYPGNKGDGGHEYFSAYYSIATDIARRSQQSGVYAHKIGVKNLKKYLQKIMTSYEYKSLSIPVRTFCDNFLAAVTEYEYKTYFLNLCNTTATIFADYDKKDPHHPIILQVKSFILKLQASDQESFEDKLTQLANFLCFHFNKVTERQKQGWLLSSSKQKLQDLRVFLAKMLLDFPGDILVTPPSQQPSCCVIL